MNYTEIDIQENLYREAVERNNQELANLILAESVVEDLAADLARAERDLRLAQDRAKASADYLAMRLESMRIARAAL